MKEKIKKYPVEKHAVLHSWENTKVVQKLIKIVEYSFCPVLPKVFR
jgi:hypothetical protein